jgi:Tfp pilus assembly protein PilV
MKKTAQSSFTLIETMIALALMVVIILEVSVVQGRAISFSAYERKVTQAAWLAKGILSHLEYKWHNFELKDVKAEFKDEKIPEELCKADPLFDCDYKYNLTIEEARELFCGCRYCERADEANFGR